MPSNSTLHDAAELFNTIRNEYDLTRSELAKLIGLSQNTVKNIETGRTERCSPVALNAAIQFYRLYQGYDLAILTLQKWLTDHSGIQSEQTLRRISVLISNYISTFLNASKLFSMMLANNFSSDEANRRLLHYWRFVYIQGKNNLKKLTPEEFTIPSFSDIPPIKKTDVSDDACLYYFRKYRLDHMLNQRQWSEMLNIAPDTVKKIEAGILPCSKKNFERAQRFNDRNPAITNRTHIATYFIESAIISDDTDLPRIISGNYTFLITLFLKILDDKRCAISDMDQTSEKYQASLVSFWENVLTLLRPCLSSCAEMRTQLLEPTFTGNDDEIDTQDSRSKTDKKNTPGQLTLLEYFGES